MKRQLPQLGKISLCDPKICARAVMELHRVTGIPRKPSRKGWCGYAGLIYKDVTFVSTYTHSKPPLERVVAWPINGHVIWLPSERHSDLVELCSSLGETTVSDYAIWHEFVHVDYGLVYRGVPPRIVDAGVAQTFGIVTTPRCDEREAVFWQEWGGKLFSINLGKSNGTDVNFEYRVVGLRVGKYKPLPIHARR